MLDTVQEVNRLKADLNKTIGRKFDPESIFGEDEQKKFKDRHIRSLKKDIEFLQKFPDETEWGKLLSEKLHELYSEKEHIETGFSSYEKKRIDKLVDDIDRIKHWIDCIFTDSWYNEQNTFYYSMGVEEHLEHNPNDLPSEKKEWSS